MYHKIPNHGRHTTASAVTQTQASRKGLSLPAVPVLQQKNRDEDLQMKAVGPRDLVKQDALNGMAPVQLVSYYHGGGKAFVDTAIAGAHTAKSSMGELGSKGMYYWKDDENAALVSSAIYNKAADWAVMKIDINPAVMEASKPTTKYLGFPSESVAPTKVIAGAASKVYGLHYKFIQNNLDTKLGLATADASVERTLDPAYADLTGRAFLDSFDFVVSPTKAEGYKHAALRQARANDTGLSNLIYGVGPDEEENTFTKTWEGKITDGKQNTAIETMGLSKKDEVPAKMLEMHGKKGASIVKL